MIIYPGVNTNASLLPWPHIGKVESRLRGRTTVVLERPGQALPLRFALFMSCHPHPKGRPDEARSGVLLVGIGGNLYRQATAVIGRGRTLIFGLLSRALCRALGACFS